MIRPPCHCQRKVETPLPDPCSLKLRVQIKRIRTSGEAADAP